MYRYTKPLLQHDSLVLNAKGLQAEQEAAMNNLYCELPQT